MTNIWMPIYWGDYFKDTFHLSAEEHGAYFLLMGYYWQNGKIPRDLDLIKNITKLSEKKLSRVMKFFTVEGMYYTHSRLEKEKQKSLELKEKKSKAGKKGMDSRYNKATNSVITELQQSYNPSQSQSQSPSPDVIDVDDMRARVWKKVDELMKGRVVVLGRVDKWLESGADEAMIMQVLSSVLENKGGDPPTSLKYFDQPIANAIADKNTPLPKGTTNAEHAGHTKTLSGGNSRSYGTSKKTGELNEQLQIALANNAAKYAADSCNGSSG